MILARTVWGCAGAGKTEATKKCLEFFTHAAGSTGVGLEEKVRGGFVLRKAGST